MTNVNNSGNVANQNNGLFVVFEGGEGSGKSTQARLLSKALCAMGVHNHLTREPGDTELGADLREILLKRGRSPIAIRTEALLFAADRAEHVDKLVRPALDRGDVVVCDRYIASSMAYQSYAGGLSKAAVKFLSEWASRSLQPDITFLLDVSPEVGLERAKKVDPGRFEDKTLDYHTMVRMGFLSQRNPSWITLDGTGSVVDLHRTILINTLKVYQNRMVSDESTSTRV
jgi:dTMP kinase